MDIKLKRVYEKPEESDGTRILVDRLWPRGLSKEQARIEYWAKELAPSNALRSWFQHDPEKWPVFKQKYFAELDQEPDRFRELLRQLKTAKLTFVFSARSLEYNNALALKEYLEGRKLTISNLE